MTEIEDKKLARMDELAVKAVNTAVAATTITGAVPIPFADAPLLIAEQVALMTTIAGIYEINLKKDGLKVVVGQVLGAGGATLVGRTVATSLLKMVPFAGSIVGGAISAATAGSVTYAMGTAFIELCKMVKAGKLDEAELVGRQGVAKMKEVFEKVMKGEFDFMPFGKKRAAEAAKAAEEARAAAVHGLEHQMRKKGITPAKTERQIRHAVMSSENRNHRYVRAYKHLRYGA